MDVSQSLFIQGWGTTRGNLGHSDFVGCLNPFSFRAGVLPIENGSVDMILCVSIPFHSGLGYYGIPI